MERQIKQSMVISVLVHAAIVGVAFLFILFETWLKKPEPVVFELVAAAAPQVRETQQEAVEDVPLEPVEPLKVDQPEPIKKAPEVPDLPKPKPPEPKPEPKPTPKPEPKPEPEPVKKLSYDEWKRNRDLPERVQRVQQPKPKPVQNVPEIETDVRARLEKQLSPIKIQGVDLSQIESSDALQRYLSALRQRIQQAFEPSGSNLEAEAYFTVTAQGTLSSARIHRSSGNAAFDRSVLRTLQTARTPGPPPGNRSYEFSLIFRSE
jgi:TonB family protein